VIPESDTDADLLDALKVEQHRCAADHAPVL
jgi:hypothetical protein